jgi:hypothetical protein
MIAPQSLPGKRRIGSRREDEEMVLPIEEMVLRIRAVAGLHWGDYQKGVVLLRRWSGTAL